MEVLLRFYMNLPGGRMMEKNLVVAVDASGEETELEKHKMRAAEDQLELIRLAKPFSAGVRSLLESV